MPRTWLTVTLLVLAGSIPTLGHAQWVAQGLQVCSDPSYQAGPRMVSDGAGGAIVAWLDFRSGLGSNLHVQRVSSAGFPLWDASGVPIGPLNAQYDHQVVTDGQGGAIIVWLDERGDDADLYAQRVSASGEVLWDEDGVPCTAPADQEPPAVVADGQGGAIIVWEDSHRAYEPRYLRATHRRRRHSTVGSGRHRGVRGGEEPIHSRDRLRRRGWRRHRLV